MLYGNRYVAPTWGILARPPQLGRCQAWIWLLSLVGKTAHGNFTLSLALRSWGTPRPFFKLLSLVWLSYSFLLFFLVHFLLLIFGLIPWGRSRRPKGLKFPSHGLNRTGEGEAPLSPPDLGPFMEGHYAIYSPSPLLMRGKRVIF